jgi:molecular chaperone DnaK
VSKDDTAGIKAASEALQKEVMDMGAAMYQQAPGAGAPGSSSGAPGEGAGPAGGAAGGSSSSSGGSSSSSAGPRDDGTIDAEFTDAK